jgi:SOS regulatory protein LexA
MRKVKRLTQQEIASRFNVSQNTYSYWENGKVNLDNSTIANLAEFYGVSVDFLIGRKYELTIPPSKWHESLKEEYENGDIFLREYMEYKHGGAIFPSNTTKMPPDIQGAMDVAELEMYPIPLLGRVVAGVPIESQENLEGYVFINHKPKEEYFALKVFGDSMINAGIPDGAILIVHKQSYADNGNVIVAFLNGEQTVKYFKTMNEDMYLVPANNNYLPIPIRKGDDFMILGKVVEIRVSL